MWEDFSLRANQGSIDFNFMAPPPTKEVRKSIVFAGNTKINENYTWIFVKIPGIMEKNHGIVQRGNPIELWKSGNPIESMGDRKGGPGRGSTINGHHSVESQASQ